MKQYTFKDGTKVIASTREEAIQQHKVVASETSDTTELLETLYSSLKDDKKFYKVYLSKPKSFVSFYKKTGKVCWPAMSEGVPLLYFKIINLKDKLQAFCRVFVKQGHSKDILGFTFTKGRVIKTEQALQEFIEESTDSFNEIQKEAIQFNKVFFNYVPKYYEDFANPVPKDI